MISHRGARNRTRTEEYLRKLDHGSNIFSGRNNFEKNCLALRRLIETCPYARCNRFDSEFMQAVFNRNFQALCPWPKFLKVRPENFHRPLTLLVNIEELWEHIHMRHYDRQHGRILTFQNPGDPGKWLYQCEVTGLSREEPSIISHDCVILSNSAQEAMMFPIVDIDGDLMTFTMALGECRPMIASRFMSFVPSGINSDRFLRALDMVNNSAVYKKMIFPDKEADFARRSGAPNPQPKIDFKRTNTNRLRKRLDKCNHRQRQAIINILEAECRPNPYILFGPPGTGKTSTLVELVVQIHKRSKTARVLVCASSNTCANFIADLIANTNNIDSLARLIPKYRLAKLEDVPAYFTTDPNKANRHRVIVTTNSSAARLRRCDFDYVIIDEAGHSHIPESLVPLTRLKRDGCLVLAGDPKQLGPTVKCDMIRELKIAESLLYHMCDIYPYRSQNGQYNERFITKLIDSYRCDPRILGLCSKLFYENELNCLGKTPPRLLEELELKGPLVFAPVGGEEKSPAQSTSRFNLVEARKCIDFLMKLYKIGLHPDQIGIITPYKLHKSLLTAVLEDRIEEDKSMLIKLLKSDERFSYKNADKL